MTIAPTTQTEALTQICDDLLDIVRRARLLPAGALPTPQVADIVDRILDTRNRISPPTKKPTNQDTKP